MIIHNFYSESVAFLPAETDPPLVINAKAVLAFPSALERFQSVARRHGHVPQFSSGVQSQQLAARAALDGRRKPARKLCAKNPLRFAARKTPDLKINGVKRQEHCPVQIP